MPRIVLWTPPEERPSYAIYDWDGNLLEEGPMLTADEVFCDLCNNFVPLNPVPVIEGYALCLDCLQEIDPKWSEQIPLEVLLVWKWQLDEVNQ